MYFYFLLLRFFGIHETNQRSDSRQQISQVPHNANDSTDETDTDHSENDCDNTAGNCSDDPDCNKIDEFLLRGDSFKADILGFDDTELSINNFFDIHNFYFLNAIVNNIIEASEHRIP